MIQPESYMYGKHEQIARLFSFRVDDLLCGGMVSEVREAFAEAMSSVVQLAAHHPIASAGSIGLLCTIPYTRYVAVSTIYLTPV